MTDSSEGAIWSRLIRPESDDLSAEAAQSILGLKFRDEDAKRAHELMLKNKEDALSAGERVDLENYARVGRVLDLMHSKARRSLKHRVKR